MNLFTRTSLAILAMATLTSTWISCSKSKEDTAFQNPESTIFSGARFFESGSSLNRTEVNTVPALCGTSTVKNFVKNSSTYGSITVGNDATDYYITISGQNGWTLKDISLYAGTEAGIPLNGGGMPQFGSYPVQKSNSAPCPSSWSLKIPVADLGNNYTISVRTNFRAANGTTEAIWSEGIAIKPNTPPTKFSVGIQTCIIDEGCAYGQGYWFGNGNLTWPDVNGGDAGHVTIGGETYTRDEARAIWWANNGLCPGIPNAKKAFAFVAAIRLSDDNVIGNAGLWNDLALVDGWLASLDRLSPANICDHPAAPDNVKAAIARLGDWMDTHDCE